MNIIRSMLVCGVASSVLVGCTTHPLPEDVTRKNTYAIVQKIRCEAREAVKQELIAVLLQSSYPHTRELGEDLASGRLRPEKLVFADIDDPEARDLVSKYSQAAIAHEFEFTISEGSDNTASLTLKDPLTNGGMFTLDLTGGHKRTRKNVRNFITSDTFGAMFDKKSYMVCAKFPASKEKDWIYPITGSIGTAELIHTFLLLSENANLYDKGVTRDATHVTRTISDTLTFTTSFTNLSFGPGLTLMPQTQSLELTAASGAAKPDRSDQHEVAISLSIREPKAAPVVPGLVRAPAATLGGVERNLGAEAAAVEELIRRKREDFFQTQQDIREFLDEQR